MRKECFDALDRGRIETKDQCGIIEKYLLFRQEMRSVQRGEALHMMRLRSMVNEFRESTNNRGGKREGAGRKPRQQPRVALTIRVEPEISERFKKVCESKNRSQSEQMTEWVKRARL